MDDEPAAEVIPPGKNRPAEDGRIMSLEEIRDDLRQHASPERAEVSRRFFKTGPGQYGEGDRFLGIRVPELRKISLRNRDLGPKETLNLLKSPLHEERLLALLILVLQYRRGTPETRQKIYVIYLKHTRYINNWDLVDTSAEHIVGAHLQERNRAPLYTLAVSSSLWERRISILSTFHYIKKKDFTDTLKIARILLHDPQDLIHKAAGWMLREVGKRDAATEEAFLLQQYREMPRTMLRYAIEQFPERKRQAFLKGKA